MSKTHYYRYIGDTVGTDLENTVYRVVRHEVGRVLLRTKGGEEVRVTREEWDYHLDGGLLVERDGF
jgi:hypothetical protein